MRGRVGRIATTAILATGVGVSGALLGAPAAEAAAQPVVAGDCNATVTGHPGQPVALDLGNVLGIGSGPLIPVGAIPQAGSAAVNAAPLVQKAAQDKGLIGGVVGGLTKVLAGGCSVTETAVNGVAAPVQQATAPVMKAVQPATKPLAGAVQGFIPGSQARPSGPPPTQPAPPKPNPQPTPPSRPPGQPGPGGGTNPGVPVSGGNSAQLPLPAGTPYPASLLYGQLGYGPNGFVSPTSLFGNLPLGAQGFNGQGFGLPGSMAPPTGAGYGLQIPGLAPSAGQLNVPPIGPANGDPVRNAGSAQALPASSPTNPVGLPLLVAVIVLSGVTAGLVRTWLLRRVSS